MSLRGRQRWAEPAEMSCFLLKHLLREIYKNTRKESVSQSRTVTEKEVESLKVLCWVALVSCTQLVTFSSTLSFVVAEDGMCL